MIEEQEIHPKTIDEPFDTISQTPLTAKRTKHTKESGKLSPIHPTDVTHELFTQDTVPSKKSTQPRESKNTEPGSSSITPNDTKGISCKTTQPENTTKTGEAIAIEEVQTDEGEVPESQLTEPIIEEPAEKEDLKPAKKKKSVKKKAVKPEESKPEPTPPTEEAQPLDKPKESKPEEIKPEEIKQKKAATKLQPMKIERKTMEPQKPQFAVAKEEEAPLFTSVKLRKSSVAPRKEAEPVKAPTFLLKSRIKRIEYPPKLHYLTITQLEPVEVDRGILSRNYEEAQKIKKKKVKKIKLSEIETAEKEEYIPYEEEKPDKVSETPETKSIKLPKEKPVEEVEEPIKIKIGKGQVPQEEVLEEKVALKKQPKKPEDVPEEVAKVPKKPKPEEPLKPTEPDEASFKLKPVKPIETGEPDDLEQPKETVPEEEKEKIVEPVKKKTPKVKTPKEEEKPEEKSFPLGKGKKPEEEAEPEIQLRKKQGSPAKEVPEPIKLKPFEKEKPTPEEPEKKLTGPKPEPSDIARPEEEIKPKEFDIDDKQKKKKKVKKPEKDNEVPEPIEKPQEIVEPEKPRMKLQRLEKVEVKFDKPKLLTAVIGVVEGPFSVKLRRIKVEKVGEEPNVLEQFLLKSRIQRNKYPPAPQTLTVTDLTPPVRGNGVISRNYEEAQEELRKRPSKKKLPKKPKPELETLDIPELEKKPKEESAVEETVRHPSKKETPAEEDVEPTKIVLGKGKIPKDEPEAEVVKLKKIAPKPEDKQLEEKKPKKVESQISDKEKPERKYSDTPLRPVEDLEFPEAPVEEHLEPETPKEIEEQEKEESPKKKPKEKKPKPEEHEEPRPFELGKGKKPEPEPQDEVKFRIPEKPKEPEEPEGITLKPFKKDSSEKPQEEPETEFEGKLPKKEKKGVKDSDKTKKVKKKKTPSEDKPVSPEKEMSPEKLPMPEKEESPRPEKKIEEKQVEKEKPKLVAIKIERKEIKATKMKVEELKPEQPLFTTVKLRKSSVTPKADKPKTDEPKRFLLKSRITHVRYPPEMQFPVFSTLPKAEVDCGILSRNYKEAEKLPKKKVKKIKLTEKEETQLEEYEPYQEEPESPKQEEPEKVVKPRERPGKKLSKDEEPEKLVLGKGTIPKEEEKPEEVKLRKVKPKEEEEVPLEEKPKKKPEEELVTKKKPKEEKSLDKLEPLKDLPGDGERVELEKPEKLPEIEKEKAPKEEEPVKRKSLKKKKPEPEEPAGFPLGKGKPRPEEEPEEITFRKPTPKDEETPSEEIKLKPFKKEKPEIEDEPSPEVKLTIGKPAEKPVEEELETVSIKKKKPKKKETSPEEETVSVVMKPKKVEDVPAEAEVVRLRKPSKPEDQEVEEQIVLMRKKPEKKVIEEVESDFTIKKIEQTYTEEEAFDNVTIKKKAPKKPYVMEEEAAEITIQKEEPVKKPELEDTMVLKMTFKEQPKEEEEVATAVIKPRRKVSEDVTEEVTVKKEKKKSISGETVSGDAVTVKKITKAKKKYSISEEAGELTIQKTEEVQEEVPAVSFRKPSKPKISEEELPAQAITLKKPKKPLVEEPEIVESVTFAPKVVKHKEDIEQEFSIKMGSYEEEEVEMSGKVKLPRKKKPSFAEEASSETIYIEQEVETPYSVEEGPEENVQIGLRRPKPKTIQKEEVEQEFKIKMGSYEEEEVEMSGKVRLPKKKKPVSFAEEADSETIYIEQEVEEGPADVKFPLRRKSSTTPYSIEEVEEEVQLGLRKPRKESIVYEEESLELKVKRKPSKPTIQSFHQEEASLHITKVVEEPSELRIVEATEGSPLFSICSYIAETDDALSLVEGEKVYVIESNNSDWWFVKKHLTEEKGWVPAVYLRDEPSYTLYVQKKLHEKIDKLPIFEKPGPGANVFAPKFVEKLQPKRVSDGGVVQFECKVEGNPRPQITWFRQTAIIKPSHDFQIFYDDDNVATLIISEIFPEDAGTFTCVAKNAAGFASSTTELIVESPLSDHGSDTTGLSRRSLSRESSLADILEGIPPTFSRKPKAKVVSPGSDVELEVRLVAIPEPEIHWFLKNKPVTPSANVTITTQSDMHMYANTMKISKVSRGQEGTYTVVAKNREGEASVDIILKIKTGEPEPPVVVDLVKDVTVTEGEGIVLTAQVAGVPTPKVVWLKDGRPVKLESTAVGDTHTAIVRNSKPSDAGKYTLEATNSQGKASSTANVTVQGHTDALHKGDSSSRDESKQSQDGSSGSSACTVVDLHVSDIKSEAKYSETRTKEFSSVKTTEFASMESLQTLTHESHVQEVVGVVSKITQKIDRLENTIDDLVKRLSRPTESSSRSSNITISDFETSESESRAEVSEKSISESKTLTESSTGFKSSLKTLTRQRSAKEEKERVVMTKDDFVEKVKSIGNQLRSRLQPDRYIKRVKQQCDQYDRRQQAPLFVERFEEVKVGEKGTIKLTAKVVGNPIPSVSWFRNNKILLASPRITEMFDGEQILLEIENADSEQDAGDYKCVATNALGSATNGAKVTVDVAKVYFTKKLPSKYTVDENKNIVLECETSHTVSTTWFHDGKELSGMDNRELVQEGRTQRLVIKKASRKDKGTYSCTVKDQKTETSLIINEVKPDFVRKLDDFEVKELQCAILEVEVSSDAADVVWTKDGFPLEPTPGKIEMEKRGPVHKLFIRSTSVHDEGEYTCQLGDEECSAEVTVIELPPEILTHLQDTSVPRGEKACLEVELTKGDALVRWFKDDVELQFSEHVQLSIDGKRQKLKIYQAEDSDSGVYSCKVGDQVSTARLTVEEPKVEFITRLPDVTMVPVGSDAEFTVELSLPDVEVKWLRKGKEIKPKANRYIITSSGATRKLVIKKVTLEDQTDITCMAINIKTTSKLKIEVIQTAPRITLDQKEYKVRKGEDVTFNLKFTGTPILVDEWTVNGTVIKPSKRLIPRIDEESASLTIKQLEESDVGNYTLKLKNNVGEASAELTIIFIEVPSAPGTPEIVEVTDSSVTVTWKEPASDGNSPISSYILEHHDKEEFLTWKEITNITERTHKVTNLTKSHEYNFRVSAVNEVGKGKTSESSRYVKVEAPGSTQAPSFKEPLVDKACGISKPVTLSCIVAGIPDPEVKWFKDGKGLKSKTISYSNHVAKLTIESVVETSSGTYSCKASNSAGTAETSCKLLVQEAPTLKIDDDALLQRLELRSQWKPVVEFSGYPAPQISWSKDGVPLVTDKRVTSYTDEKTTTVAIYSTDRKDSGTYTVTATNIAGSATLDLKLNVIDKPTRPETIEIKDVEGEAVTIQWTPPADDGGVDISKYSLEKCDASKMIWTKVADIERDTRTYVVQRLQCNAEYMFRIFAQNPVGTSEPAESTKVEITSKLGRPSAPTRPVEVTGMTETSCTVSWGIPESDGGAPIVDYSVERKETDSDNWVKVGTTKERQIIVSELRKGKSYDFRIFARNRVGSSPPIVEENIIAGKTKTPPSPPNNVQVINIASKSVTIQWETPLSNGGSELTDYVIEKQVNGTNTWTKVVTLDATVLRFTIENLKEKSELYFRVFAENAVGLSLPTTTSLVSLKTHATVPSPPTAPLEMRSTGANSVMVSWGVPESDGGAPIEGYKIAVRDIKKTMWMEVGRVGADVQKLTIKDLQENHEYLIRIYARNEVGMSDPLEPDEPFKVQRPTAGGEDTDVEDSRIDKDTPSLSFTTTTQSWMREAGMDPDIRTYSQSALLRRSEYFFRIWYYAKHLFK